MNKGTRYEVRTKPGSGWAKVTVKEGYSSSTKTVETFSVRSGADVLVKVSAKAKAKGAKGITWGACSSSYWVGFTS